MGHRYENPLSFAGPGGGLEDSLSDLDRRNYQTNPMNNKVFRNDDMRRTQGFSGQTTPFSKPNNAFGAVSNYRS